MFRVVSPHLFFNAVEVTHNGANIGCLSVLGTVEMVGRTVTEDYMMRIGNEEVEKDMGNVSSEDDQGVNLVGGLDGSTDRGKVNDCSLLSGVEHFII